MAGSARWRSWKRAHAASGAVYEQTGQSVAARFGAWSGRVGLGDDYDAQTTLRPNEMKYGSTVYDSRQATFTTKAKDKLWRHGNWDSVHQSIYDWDPAFQGTTSQTHCSSPARRASSAPTPGHGLSRRDGHARDGSRLDATGQGSLRRGYSLRAMTTCLSWPRALALRGAHATRAYPYARS